METTAQPYAYARNNPLRYIDPTGTIDCEIYSDACVAGSSLKGLGLGVLDTVKTMFYPWDAINEHLRVCAAGMYNGQQAEADLLCLDGMNPIAGIRDGFTAAWSSAERGCYEDFGRQFAAPVIGTALTVAPFAKGAPGTIRSRALGGSDRGSFGLGEDIVATDLVIPGTGVVPKSFEMTAGGAQIWVSPNVTKHLAEVARYLNARGSDPSVISLGMEGRLASLHAAVSAAVEDGIPLNKPMTVGAWELEFRQSPTDRLPVLMHARMVG